MDYKDSLAVDATLVANEFLDNYMPKANGDYVKVYLYLLKNRIGGIDVATIAENLELTEGDVRRALKYWEEAGLLVRGSRKAEQSGCKEADASVAGHAAGSASGKPAKAKKAAKQAAEPCDKALLDREELRRAYKKTEGAAALNRLSEDAEFSQLLFVVQKYMSKILTDHDQQVFAYLYDGLNMPCDVLEYLVEYCVQTGHTSTRYIETVGLDWADSGIREVEAAKERTRSFEKNREESGRKKAVRRSKFGVTRDTDYNTVFNDKSNAVFEQVVKKLEQNF
ncbi:MAG: DnaD domain protein [Eubacteriales bacterium]|nr:DnaD domain protein [Eubacteriales bacterium]